MSLRTLLRVALRGAGLALVEATGENARCPECDAMPYAEGEQVVPVFTPGAYEVRFHHPKCPKLPTEATDGHA